jgi:hypothetical protein
MRLVKKRSHHQKTITRKKMTMMTRVRKTGIPEKLFWSIIPPLLRQTMMEFRFIIIQRNLQRHFLEGTEKIGEETEKKIPTETVTTLPSKMMMMMTEKEGSTTEEVIIEEGHQQVIRIEGSLQ